MKDCPNCGYALEVDETLEFNASLPFEIVCFDCGWFDLQHYATREKAEEKIDGMP